MNSVYSVFRVLSGGWTLQPLLPPNVFVIPSALWS